MAGGAKPVAANESSSIGLLLSWLLTKRRWLLWGALGLYIWRRYRALAVSRHSTCLLDPHSCHQLVNFFPQYIVNDDGLWLYWRGWPAPRPRGIVFIVHGFGEHCHRYDHFASVLNQAGLSVYALDHQGHGQSWGDRAYVEQFSHYARDYIQFVRYIEHSVLQNQQLPTFLFGHSMGGLVSVRVVAQSRGDPDMWPWSGVIFSSSPFHPVIVGPAALLKKITAFVAHHLPKLPTVKLDHSALSRIPSVVTHYQTDSLVYAGGVRARWFKTFSEETEYAYNQFRAIDYPFFAFHGSADRISRASGSQELHSLAASVDKTLKIYKDGYHELIRDMCYQEVITDILEWINKHITSIDLK